MLDASHSTHDRDLATSDTIDLSIIVPVLNESGVISRTLRQLQAMRKRGVQVIVVDGGSHDATLIECNPLADEVCSSEPGRACQMNYGAQIARGDVLLFLHADTLLPEVADQIVMRALGKLEQNDIGKSPDRACSQKEWGRFDVIISGRHPMLAVIGLLMNLRSRLTGIATGDQGIFVSRRLFNTIGGFPDQPLMEDIAMSTLLKSHCKPACLREKVITSGRRWETRGIWRTIGLMWYLRWRYWRGESPETLAQRYR